MSIRTTLVKWFVPSKWVEIINGNKTYLGLICFFLWAAIYAVPAVCQAEYCIAIAAAGVQVQQFLISIGINISTELLNLASVLVLAGVADKITEHRLTKVVLGVLRMIEEPIAKLIEKGEGTVIAKGTIEKK